MSAIWNWLVAQGLIRDLISALVGTAVAWRPWRRHRKLLTEVRDLLDTTVPGGLTELLGRIKSKENDG